MNISIDIKTTTPTITRVNTDPVWYEHKKTYPNIMIHHLDMNYSLNSIHYYTIANEGMSPMFNIWP